MSIYGCKIWKGNVGGYLRSVLDIESDLLISAKVAEQRALKRHRVDVTRGLPGTSTTTTAADVYSITPALLLIFCGQSFCG